MWSWSKPEEASVPGGEVETAAPAVWPVAGSPQPRRRLVASP
jgi:hypothetical protein